MSLRALPAFGGPRSNLRVGAGFSPALVVILNAVKDLKRGNSRVECRSGSLETRQSTYIFVR
jgi:hypothetical protein